MRSTGTGLMLRDWRDCVASAVVVSMRHYGLAIDLLPDSFAVRSRRELLFREVAAARRLTRLARQLRAEVRRVLVLEQRAAI